MPVHPLIAQAIEDALAPFGARVDARAGHARRHRDDDRRAGDLAGCSAIADLRRRAP